MKIDKINLDGKKDSIEVLDKIFLTFYTKLMLTIKVDTLKQNSRTKLLDLLQRFMLKKELVEHVMRVEKHLYLLVVV